MRRRGRRGGIEERRREERERGGARRVGKRGGAGEGCPNCFHHICSVMTN